MWSHKFEWYGWKHTAYLYNDGRVVIWRNQTKREAAEQVETYSLKRTDGTLPPLNQDALLKQVILWKRSREDIHG